MLLGCHVNVEFCANLLGSIKYIHKYISKGPDGAADEIRHYQDCHYISPPEAMWHIFQFALHGCTPTVYRLQLHLQGEMSWYNLPSPSPPTPGCLQPHLPPLCTFCLHSAPTLKHTFATCTTTSHPLSD